MKTKYETERERYGERKMKRVSQLFKNYKGRLVAVLILMVLQALGTLYIPTLMSDIVNKGIVESDLAYIYLTGGKMLITAVLTAAAAIAGAWMASSLASRWGRDIRERLFDSIQKFSIRDFDRFGTASMITRSTNDVAQLQDTLLLVLQLVLPAPFITVGGLILAFSKDTGMALLILAALSVFIMVGILLCTKAIPLYQKLRLGMDEMNRTLRERISGVRVIRAFNRVEHERKRTNQTFSGYGETAVRVNKIFAVMMPVVLLVINLCSLGIIWFGGKRTTAGYMQIGDIMALVEYAMLIFWNLVMAVMMIMQIPRAQTSAARINEVLSVDPDIGDGDEEVPSVDEDVPVLEFRNVTFQYENAEEPVLENICFSCRAGQKTAIIGGTGSGKSTISNLIMRFYDAGAGALYLNGKDIRNISQKELRNQIGFVPQKAFLFSGTIEENLRYGNLNARAEELERAASIAQAEEFINSTPDGYGSIVAQGGMNFSGGQRQRLCIARALVKQTPLYVFDDSFSALDFKTDSNLRAALKKEVKRAAMVVVAQRVSSITDADQIIVLENGAIAAIGTHEELLKTSELYMDIVNSQQREGNVS